MLSAWFGIDATTSSLCTQVDPSCNYDNLVCIESFDSHVSLCGGINLPKVISCLGTDGRRRRQLVKGRDDLRQDAVMQQVFVLVNQLLAKEPATTKRKLSIRTYRVSRRVGRFVCVASILALVEFRCLA